MINIKEMTNEQIKHIGLKVIERELGPVGMIRFIQQFELGKGDYTKEREKLLKEKDIEKIVGEIKKK
jgi:hypothetical protein